MMHLKNCGQESMQSIRFASAEGLTAGNIASILSDEAKRYDIPVTVWTDTIKSGGLLGSTYPCVLLKHPNPPQEYYKHIIIINGNILNFRIWGDSKVGHNKGLKASLKERGTLSGMIMGALIKDDEMAYQVEMGWHGDVLNLFSTCFLDD